MKSCHHNAESYHDEYLASAGIRDKKKAPLFRSVDKHKKLTENPMTRTDVLRMVNRRTRSRTPLLHLLPHVPRNGDHRVP